MVLQRFLVTGANSMVGLAVTRKLHSLGHQVIGTFHENAVALEELCATLPNATAWGPFDISSQASVRKLARHVELLNGLSGIVNGASFSSPSAWNQDLLSCDPYVFSKTFDVETVGWLMLIPELYEHLLDDSSIVLFGSASARPADRDTAVYNPAKEALRSLAVHLAKSLAPKTRVNVILPGAIMSDWVHKWPVTQDEIASFKASRKGLCRLGEPDEVAAVAAFLMGRESSYVNAQSIGVDGGSQA